MQINDGTGRGYVAQVTSASRLATDSVANKASAQASRAGNAYVISTSGTLAPNATGGTMIFLRNDSQTESVLIDEVMIGCDNTKLVIKEYLGMAVATLADKTDTKAHALNSGFDSNGLITACYWDGSNNGIGGLSDGTVIGAMTVSTGTIVLSRGGDLVVGPGSNYAIFLDNNSGGTLNAAITVKFFTETI
tara:strand:- start:5116 stop:5688 length:573 start_codon:yes stop_codon:yes gene_type:complete